MRVVYKGRAEGGMAPPILGITRRSAFIYKRTINVCDNCSRTSAPSVPHLRVSVYLCRSRSNVRVEVEALEEHRVSSKEGFYFKGPRLGKCWEDGRD